uniref:Uncharacterized protein n=1 Tax=Moniliophthora roreri TaxID=221103 RepID=A0A0W0FR08_MONRR
MPATKHAIEDHHCHEALRRQGLSLLSTRYSTETALFEAWFSLSKSAVISSSRLLSMLAQQTSTPNCTIAIMVSNYRVPSRTVPSQEALLTALACKVIWMLEMFRPTSRLLFRGLQNAAFADVDIGAEYGAPFSTKDEELTLISDQNQGLCSTGKELCYPHHSLCDVGITVGGVHDEDSCTSYSPRSASTEALTEWRIYSLMKSRRVYSLARPRIINQSLPLLLSRPLQLV